MAGGWRGKVPRDLDDRNSDTGAGSWKDSARGHRG